MHHPTRHTIPAAGATVYLVGAGPGDPDLLTVRALRLLQEAEVVVHDRLVGDAVLDLVPAKTPLIDVGKSMRRHTLRQEEINDLLVELACRYRRVVRLKGGDPFVFGRGGEEAMHLAQAGVPFEVVPGVTSAQGCAAALAIPLTHRDAASSLRFLTGHCREDAELAFDWPGLCDPHTTLVVYMGLANIGRIARDLIRNGRDARTPVVAVNNGSLPGQRYILAPLAEIGPAAAAAQFEGPVLFIIGEVVNVGLALGTLRHDAPAQHLVAAE
jgi:uroporphyrin-III C-methyltransferase